MDIFFIEVERLARPDGFIAITEIASMIKNDIDMFPKWFKNLKKNFQEKTIKN